MAKTLFEEIVRRVEAICLHYGIGAEELGDRLVISDVTLDVISIASKTGQGQYRVK